MNPKRAIEDRFPKLTGEGYSLTSSPTDAYNCVAWIARDVRRWWSPEDGLSRHRCGQVSAFWPCDRVTWEARQTLTTLEATRPDRGRRSCERGAPSGAGRTRSPPALCLRA